MNYPRRTTFLRLTFLLALMLCCPAQANYFQKRLIDNNLPNVGIYSITQDQHGYLWLASTNIGLMQYDGHQFQRYPLLNRSLTQLKWVPDIDALAFDQDNNLWAGSWGYGLAKINAEDGSIDLFSGAPDDALASAFVQTLFMDKQQRLWIGTTGGINQYNAQTGLTRVDTASDVMPSRRVWAFAQTPDDTIWIATSAGLYYWQPQLGLMPVALPPEEAAALQEIRTLHVIGDEVWLGSNTGLFVYQPKLKRFKAITLPGEQLLPIINTLASSVEGHLLVGTFSGIYAVDPKRYQFIRRLRHKLAELEHINVRSIFVDQSEVTWVGTRESGLYFKTRQRRAFQNTDDAALAKLQRDLTTPVLSLLAEADYLWLGQYGKLLRYEHANQQTLQFTLDGRVNVIRRAPDGVLWVGTDRGVFKWDTIAGNFVRFSQPFQAFNLAEQNARDIRFLDDNKVLINLWNNGVVLLDNTSGNSQHVLANISQNIVGDAIQAVTVTPDAVWLASRLSGLYRLDRQTNQLVEAHQVFSSALLTPEHTGQITCIDTIPGNKLALCTEQGLLQIVLDSRAVDLIKREDGLGNASLVGIHTDHNDNIWLLSTTGLFVIKHDGDITQFDAFDGLESNELMFRAVAQDKRQLYFGSGAGLELINPRLLLSPLPAVKQAISQIRLDQLPVERQSRLQPFTQLNIPAGTSRVEFTYTSFDFNNPKRNRYRYKLDGYDTEWQQLQHDNVASYTNLPPGNYQLQMMASNNQRTFSGKITNLEIAVIPQWWQQKLVQFSAIMAIIFGVGWLMHRKIDQEQRINSLLKQTVQQKTLRQAELERAVAERTAELQASVLQLEKAYAELKHLDLLKDQFISTVSHELRTPLTSISGALDLIKSGILKHQPEQAKQLLDIASSNSK
ncbi:MAG TPA: two-component regulator propeller domain-containing protein, partial [Rheinheimera sp.]|nr:two-component regulator propeller domain-containing protein [Rheinheimera sp.]